MTENLNKRCVVMDNITGTISGECDTELGKMYIVSLDKKFQGYLDNGACYVTMIVVHHSNMKII